MTMSAFIPLLISLALSAVVLGLGHYLLLVRPTGLGGEARLPRQIIMLLLTATAIIFVVVTAPLPESTRNQILSIVGIAFSGVLAFSSTSFVTNFMAAIMLRVTRPFRVGDFVTVGEHFGKVSERGLFDTEIQTESRELIAIPNSVFISTPVQVTHASGLIISTTLSLGYDTHHGRIEHLLEKAAVEAGLEDPYVHILSLGDFSVSYRVSGLLREVKTLLTSRSNLNVSVLDTLHQAGIEIMSPTFTRHITQDLALKQIPQDFRARAADKDVAAEDIAFEKANRAQAFDDLRRQLTDEIAELEAQLAATQGVEAQGRKDLAALLGRLQVELARMKKASREGHKE